MLSNRERLGFYSARFQTAAFQHQPTFFILRPEEPGKIWSTPSSLPDELINPSQIERMEKTEDKQEVRESLCSLSAGLKALWLADFGVGGFN